MKKRQWQGQIIAELLNNYSQIEPRCRHFLDCGGCSLQDFSYRDQLKVKKEKVVELLRSDSIFSDGKMPDIEIFGEVEFGYRTRMDYVVSPDGFGLRRKRRFDETVDLKECYLIDDGIFQFLRQVYQMGIEIGLQPYDLKTHLGEWRYLSVRINEKNELMLILVTKSGVEKKIDKLVDDIVGAGRDLPLRIRSVCHLINDGLADVNFGEVKKYWGDEFLLITLADVSYQIGPNTFFQNNPKLLNRLLAKMAGFIDSNDRVLDLFCGVGTLSLPMAGRCRMLLGVELMEESIKLAEKNANLNGVTNIEFIAEDVENWIANNEELISNNFNVLVLDPPRKGLEKAAELIRQYDFEKIIYMSCNPLTLKKDLILMSEKCQIDEITLWDLYPQTPHLECLVQMTIR